MIESYELNNKTIHYEMNYKKRKTLGIYFDSYGNIELRAPRDTEASVIVRFLEMHFEEIETKQKQIKAQLKGQKVRTYEMGEQFLYLGKDYPIKVTLNHEGAEDRVAFDGVRLEVLCQTDHKAYVQKLMKRFYYQKCKAVVESRIKYFQPRFKEKPRSIRISDDSATWGTCNGSREMTFNWKLAMAPEGVIDYIVVHEMCHMVHLNHDRSFWRLVGKHMPEYEISEQWLSKSYWQMVV